MVVDRPVHEWWRDPWWQEQLFPAWDAESATQGGACRKCDALLTYRDGVSATCRPHLCRRCRAESVRRLRGL